MAELGVPCLLTRARRRQSCTPDFFLFDANQQLVYRGKMDDSRPSNGKLVTGEDLRAAMDVRAQVNLLTEQKPSIGCNIKWTPGNQPAIMVKVAQAQLDNA